MHTVTWDQHSLFLDGHRLLLFSGEFQYFRLPSRQQWLDRLEKMKAAGLNTVSLYFDWAYHSSAPGQYDFSGVRDVDYLLRLTEQVGLYVIARVGPYMNAEVDAGGLPGWVLRQPLVPRMQSWNDSSAHVVYSPLFMQDSQEWFDHLLPILARHQVTNGGSIILLSVENEYSQSAGSAAYMQNLYQIARTDGITVPIFHNDDALSGKWANSPDLYAYDSYPYGFDCCHDWSDSYFHGIDSWETTLRSRLSIQTPMFVAELQGGMFEPWGGKGYAAVAQTLGADWLTAIDQSALAQGATILNTYMFVGGTTWGYMGEPGVYTSYDYGAPISETGALRPAYYAAHRLALFLQTYGTELAGAVAAPIAVTSQSPMVAVHSRVDPQTGDLFVFLRQGDPGGPVTTHLDLTVGGHSWLIPQKQGTALTIPGHGAAVLTADAQTGPLHLNYSTSQVLTETSTDGGDYLVLYGPAGSEGETDFVLPTGPFSVIHNGGVEVTERNGELRLNYRHTVDPRTVEIQTTSGTLRLVITATDAASRYWVTNGMIIAGPDLVWANGNQLQLSLASRQDVRVYGGPPGRSLVIDHQVTAAPDPVMGTTLLGSRAGPGAVSLPVLGPWKFQAGAPETDPAFDDTSWIVADHTSTTNPNVPPGSTLLADDYGFHYGFVWYRGHFTASGAETALQLAARQSYSVYLNGIYLGSANESLAGPPHAYAELRTFPFPSGALRIGQDNVIAVLTESLGHDEGWLAGQLAQSPQGIISAQLSGAASPIAWRIQGDAGGEQPADTVRGIFNASGLDGERAGWYLPAFDDRSWAAVALPDSWRVRGFTGAVGWYRTHFHLALPSGGYDAVELDLPDASDQAVIWLNGWLIGRYWEQKGPQHDFYLPAGILNPNGDNVLAIAVWNQGHGGGLTAPPRLIQDQALLTHTLTTDTPVSAGSPDYWHTSGNRIVDSHGRPVRIAAVNWSGMQTMSWVPAGLDRQPLAAILAHIKALGFNAVRLPFSNQVVEQNPVVTKGLAANPSLLGLHALSILDRIVSAAGAAGLRIILDDHRSTAGFDPQQNGLWYAPGYPESAWIKDWQMLAARYRGNATVVGVDLRDEPHTAPPGPWSLKTYMHQGATWGPYQGRENSATDWRLAAERGGNAVLAVNPHLLIFVEGLQQYPDRTQPGGVDSYWWGGVLQPAAAFPVQLSVPHQLAYSPHEYGPEKYHQPFFGPRMSYARMLAVWEKHWGYLERTGYAHQTPVFLGEFGTCGQSPACVASAVPGSQGLWFSFLLRFLQSHPEIGWSFWAINGTNAGGSSQPNYIFRPDWKTLRLHQLIDALRSIEIPPPP